MPDSAGPEERATGLSVTWLGHACVLVEIDQGRVLIDPGAHSTGVDAVTGLTGILLTHGHAGHLDAGRMVDLVERNHGVPVVADHETAQFLEGGGIQAREVGDGSVLDVGTVVDVLGDRHATLHPDLPATPNVGYLLGDRLLHPGDALTVPDRPVAVALVPMSAPWLTFADTVDYVRALRPEVVIPIHRPPVPPTDLLTIQFRRLLPPGTRWLDIDLGGSVHLG